MNLRHVGVKFREEIFTKIKSIAEQQDKTISDVVRSLVEKGLAIELGEENINIIAQVVKKQIDTALYPHTERLAALSAKGAIMSATSVYLSAQALQDFVPVERRREFKDAYEAARKKAVTYVSSGREENL